MQFDSFTILIGGCALLVLLGGIFLVSWVRHREQVWLLWFGMPLVMAAIGSAGFTRPGWDTDFAAVMIGNSLRILAIASYWQGARIFEGRKAVLWPVVAAILLWLSLGFIPDFTSAHALRVAMTSVLSAIFIGMAAWELWRGRSEKLASRWPTIGVFVSFSAIMLARAAVSPVAPFPMGGGPADPFWFGVLMLVIFSHALLAGLLMLAMAMERQIVVQQAHAMIDPATGLQSRRAFNDFAVRTNRRRAGMRSSLALVVIDIDGFRQITATQGRAFADALLAWLAQQVEISARPGDHVFRLGSDRFCVAMAEASRQQAVAVAERLRAAFQILPAELAQSELVVTASIGIAETLHPVAVHVVLAAAEGAMEQARRLGGNRIVMAEAATLFRAQIDDIAGPRRGTA